MANEQLVLSDLASSGKVLAEKADNFVDLAKNNTSMMGEIQTIMMRNETRDIDTLDFGSRKLRVGTEWTEFTTLTGAAFAKRTLTAKKAMLAVDIGLDFLEENIERMDFDAKLAGRFQTLLGNDLEDLAWNGDEADVGSEKDFLNVNDGWITLIKADGASAHVYDTGPGWTDDATVFYNCLVNVPAKWLKSIGLKSYRFYTTVTSELRIRKSVADRQTNLGDFYLTQDGALSYMGVPVIGVPSFPTDHVVLAPPSNLFMGVRRELRYDSEYKPRKSAYEYTWNMKFDYEYAILDCMCLAYDKP